MFLGGIRALPGREVTRRPVSRVLSRAKSADFRMDDHSSGTPVARRLARPTRATARKTRLPVNDFRRRCLPPPYLVLLPVGFAMPPSLPRTRCALTAPFHPCRRPSCDGAAGGLLSVALSLGSPSPGVTRHRVFRGARTFLYRRKADSGHPAVWSRWLNGCRQPASMNVGGTVPCFPMPVPEIGFWPIRSHEATRPGRSDGRFHRRWCR